MSDSTIQRRYNEQVLLDQEFKDRALRALALQVSQDAPVSTAVAEANAGHKVNAEREANAVLEANTGREAVETTPAWYSLKVAMHANFALRRRTDDLQRGELYARRFYRNLLSLGRRSSRPAVISYDVACQFDRNVSLRCIACPNLPSGVESDESSDDDSA